MKHRLTTNLPTLHQIDLIKLFLETLKVHEYTWISRQRHLCFSDRVLTNTTIANQSKWSWGHYWEQHQITGFSQHLLICRYSQYTVHVQWCESDLYGANSTNITFQILPSCHLFNGMRCCILPSSCQAGSSETGISSVLQEIPIIAPTGLFRPGRTNCTLF